MQRQMEVRGFFLGFCFTLLWQAGWGVAALVLWLLHTRYLYLIALGVWPASALLATVFIRLSSRNADTSASAPENRNPYSTDNAEVFLGVANGTVPAGEPALTIMLFIWRKLIAQDLARKLSEVPNIRLFFEPSYSLTQTAVRSRAADAALIEVAESGSHHGISDCLALCARLREEAPQCKLLLMCPERNKDTVAQAIEAKRTGHIDDFVFYDASIDYVASKLLAM